MRPLRALVFCVASAIPVASGVISASAGVYWSSVASACMPEAKAIQSNLYFNPSDFSVALSSGKTKPVVLVCPVEGKVAVPLPNVLALSYKDSTATATSASVKATLVQVTRDTGARSTIATISSDDGSGAGPALIKAAPINQAIGFDLAYYYVRLDISRSASGQDVRAIGVALETSCGDGAIRGGEDCDDDGEANGDGCSSTCQVEDGYDCAGEPSICTPISGSCSTVDDCPATGNECIFATCDNNACSTDFAGTSQQTSSQTAGNCKVNVCDGSGGTQDINDDADVPNDSNACTIDTCNVGTPTHTNADPGTVCPGGLCDGNGTCVMN